MSNKPKLLADLLPSHIRDLVYAVLVMANSGLIAAELAYTLPPWVYIIVAMVNGAGFMLAKGNINPNGN